ncbi:hypothetical protein PINS_up013089 [Pythium insidiosum]|nr:hypothetical protein PINS_up013089 [Pythium insidiosum]
MAEKLVTPAAWDAHALQYEQIFERATTLWGRDAFTLAALLPGGEGDAPASTSPRELLDVACGTGALAIAAAIEWGFTVTATDYSPGMIARLDAKCRRLSASDRITCRVVDGHTLEGLADETFDVVLSNFGIFLFPDRVAAWRSALRVLRPSGRLLATSWDATSHNMRILHYVMQYAPDATDYSAADDPAKMLTPHVNRTVVAATFQEELEECGFTDVVVHTVSHPFCFQRGEEFVVAMLDNGILAAMLKTKQRVAVQQCILHYCQLVVDGRDPLDASAPVFSVDTAPAPTQHPLWSRPFAIPAHAHIAVARKKSSC